MTIRTMLIPIAGSGNMRSVMELGLNFGKELSCHIEVLYIQSDPRDTIPLLGEGMSVTMIEDMIKIAETQGNEKALENQNIFYQIVSNLSLPVIDDPKLTQASAIWSKVVGRNDEITARRGRLSDIIVVNHPATSSDVMETLIFNSALFDSGRPIMVLQPLEKKLVINPLSRDCQIGFFWNGSVQSVKALSAAIELFNKAKKITIMTAESDQISLAQVPELVNYIGRHGVVASSRSFETGRGQSIGASLLAECSLKRVNFLVMGAYAQSRVRQLILGGVTRYVLENAKIPLFMAH
jgi:nucleotide-binding universal stress UspA family protein